MAGEDKSKKSILEVLDESLTVYCSVTVCKWRRDSGYYGSCHNPFVLINYKQFMGGHVYLSGCKCERCEKDCKKECKMEVTWEDGIGYRD